jgi:hypothetical protein
MLITHFLSEDARPSLTGLQQTEKLKIMTSSDHTSLEQLENLGGRPSLYSDDFPIIGAGLLTAYIASAWPDLIVGLGIFFMNLDAAREVYVAARKERVEATA